jgi:hypothetical protein
MAEGDDITQQIKQNRLSFLGSGGLKFFVFITGRRIDD